jgi:hypothetical protein
MNTVLTAFHKETIEARLHKRLAKTAARQLAPWI